ncbi:DUF1294 domain-containing protein [Bacillus sp. FJAT-50079]|uniref:DUF1294 domain-containing protein n=1 Tax=Bacillus sp. FJAT-50079 TaxID=2833577 RepID=UPI001BCA494B|nr:DUF1294 domain-containing protein [Bacillus sp. FJAT-50079]MBS4208810.1 DUF1294 domain-containing protein [Bacillus sp. FJAT-50079]
MLRFLVIWYFIVINVWGLQLMGIDKKSARLKKKRISEKRLWMFALIGGAPGMTVGMHMYRHKTKHVTFKYGLPILAAIDLLVYIFVLRCLA